MDKLLLKVLLIAYITMLGCNNEDSIMQIRILEGTISDSLTKKPIPNVIVSDGYFVTKTDTSGKFQLKSHFDAKHIFYSLPSEYKLKNKNGAPYFYEKIDNLSNNYNFELSRLPNGKEEEFTIFFVADPQVRNDKNVAAFQSETIGDINVEKQNHRNVYGVVLGDIVYDRIDLFPIMKSLFSSTGVEFFYVIGNHDFDGKHSNSKDAMSEYETQFGPANYSFSRGNTHIVVMNSVIFNGNGTYTRGFTHDQIYWLKQNLSYIPKDMLLILCVHIPVIDETRIINGDLFLKTISDFKEVRIMSGHMHLNLNVNNSKYNFTEHVVGAACGLWWSSKINKDGAPNGYAIYTIQNNKITNICYKATRYSKDYQIRMYSPFTFGDEEGYLVANVWNADDNWKVELFEDGVLTGSMERYKDFDPAVYNFLKASLSIPLSVNGHPSTWYTQTNHLYKIKPRSKDSFKEVKVIDKFGTLFIKNEFTNNLKEFSNY